MNIKQCEKFLEKKLKDTAICNIYINKNGDNGFCIELEYWSDLGENVIISLVVDELTAENISDEMYNYWQAFDADEHASELYNFKGKAGTPTNLRALLQDADEQEKELEKIYNKLK